MAAGDITSTFEDVFGTHGIHTGTVELPTSYATGGVTPSDVDFGFDSDLDFVSFEIEASGALAFEYDRATDKIVAFDLNTAAEVANTTNISASTCRFLAVGRK